MEKDLDIKSAIVKENLSMTWAQASEIIPLSLLFYKRELLLF